MAYYFIRKQLSKLRTCNDDLMIEKGRHHGIKVAHRTCEQCDMHTVEDEYYFLLECPKYDDLRLKFLPRYYINYPNRCTFLNLISTKNDIALQNLSLFVYKSFNSISAGKPGWPNSQLPFRNLLFYDAQTLWILVFIFKTCPDQILVKWINQGGCCCSFLIETSKKFWKMFFCMKTAEIDMRGQFWVEKNAVGGHFNFICTGVCGHRIGTLTHSQTKAGPKLTKIQ